MAAKDGEKVGGPLAEVFGGQETAEKAARPFDGEGFGVTGNQGIVEVEGNPHAQGRQRLGWATLTDHPP
jgi:hypothetical protein